MAPLGACSNPERSLAMLYTALLILLILALLGALSPLGLHTYGWGASGVVAVIVIVVFIVVLTRRA
jgi:hypothetical protein